MSQRKNEDIMDKNSLTPVSKTWPLLHWFSQSN